MPGFMSYTIKLYIKFVLHCMKLKFFLLQYKNECHLGATHAIHFTRVAGLYVSQFFMSKIGSVPSPLYLVI